MLFFISRYCTIIRFSAMEGFEDNSSNIMSENKKLNLLLVVS